MEISEKRYHIIVLLLLMGSAMLHLLGLSDRPLHHDEGVNFYFFELTRAQGYYSYSSENYHGPLFFLVGSICSALFDDSVFGLRILPALVGVFAPLLVYRLTPWIGRVSTLFAYAVLSLSPSMLYFSRYAIHEALLAGLSLWLFVSCLLFFITNGRVRFLIEAGSALVLMIATKETWVLFLPPLAISLLFFIPTALLQRSWQHARRFLPVLTLASVVAIVAIYTQAFLWPQGAREFFLAFGQWLTRGTGDSGHFKPWWYFLSLVYQTEPWILLSPLVFILPRKGTRAIVIHSAATVGLLLFGTYSLIPYKTPWLGVQSTPYLLLALSVAIGTLGSYSRAGIRVAALLGCALLVLEGLSSRTFVYRSPVDENPFAYVHTTWETVELVDALEDRLHGPKPPRILIQLQSVWPLPYYLRKWKNQVDFVDSREPIPTKRYGVYVLESNRFPPFGSWHSQQYQIHSGQTARFFLPSESANSSKRGTGTP